MRLRCVLGLVLASAVLLGGCAPAASAPTPTAVPPPTAVAAPTGGAASPTKVSIAYSNLIADNLALWSAKESGVFANNGLDVDLQYIASTNAMSALLAGQVQVASTGGSEVVNSVANGADLVVVATITPVYAVFLETRPDINSADDDTGMGAAFDYYTQSVLPGLPFPKPEQFADAQKTTRATNPKAQDVRLGSLIDASFVQSSADRGLDKR